MNRPVGPLLGKPLLDCHRYPHQSSPPVQVALVRQLVDPHGGMARGRIAVLVNEELGGASDVEVGDHLLGDLAGLNFLFTLFLGARGEVRKELDEISRVPAIPGIGNAVVGLDQLERLASQHMVRIAACDLGVADTR